MCGFIDSVIFQLLIYRLERAQRAIPKALIYPPFRHPTYLVYELIFYQYGSYLLPNYTLDTTK